MNSGNNEGNINGYCKSSSPSEHGGKSYSGHGSVSDAEDDDDDEEFEDNRDDEDAKPPMSPPAEQPISLTTHGRFSNGEAESPRPQSRDSQQSSSEHKVMAHIIMYFVIRERISIFSRQTSLFTRVELNILKWVIRIRGKTFNMDIILRALRVHCKRISFL